MGLVLSISSPLSGAKNQLRDEDEMKRRCGPASSRSAEKYSGCRSNQRFRRFFFCVAAGMGGAWFRLVWSKARLSSFCMPVPIGKRGMVDDIVGLYCWIAG
jgi:hypothetical protein